jgi:hypothetical protein
MQKGKCLINTEVTGKETLLIAQASYFWTMLCNIHNTIQAVTFVTN